MFSELSNYPSRSTQIHISQINTGQVRYVPIDTNPQVSGTNRNKYFRKPILGASTVINHYLENQPTTTKPDIKPVNAPTNQSKNALTTSVGVQSIYRESETQTIPYSPEYVIADADNDPDILTVKHLKFNAGLPARQAEIDAIIQAQAKKQWLLQLPKVTDEYSFQVRLKMMEALDLHEWKQREQQIQTLQKQRFILLSKAIRENQAVLESETSQRMMTIWNRQLAKKHALRMKFDHRRAAEVRKLNEKRHSLLHAACTHTLIQNNGKVHPQRKRDWIKECTMNRKHTMSSEIDKVLAKRKTMSTLLTTASVASPTTNMSTTLDPMIASPTHIPPPLASLETLESLFPQAIIQPSIAPPTRSTHKNRIAKCELQQQVLDLDDLITPRSKMNDQTQTIMKPPRFMHAIAQPIANPPTPILEMEDDDELYRHQLALLIQRWVRGRKVQDDMIHGKSRQINWIDELRLQLEIPTGDDEFHADTRVSPRPSKSLVSHYNNIIIRDDDSNISLQDQMANKFEHLIQSNYVSQQLDFLDREIVRLQDQQKLAATALLAERTRRMREAQEAGLRQHELAVRMEEDQRFSAVMHLHQRTVDSFLEEVVTHATQQAADIKARSRVNPLSTTIDPHAINHPPDTQCATDNAIVSNLVSSFLFPETERQIVRQQVQHAQQRYLVAAHREVFKVISHEIEPQFVGVTIDKHLVDQYTDDIDDRDTYLSDLQDNSSIKPNRNVQHHKSSGDSGEWLVKESNSDESCTPQCSKNENCDDKA